MGSEAIRYGPEGWPERTLFDYIQPWCHRHLRHPDGPRAGQPWAFTDEQARFVAWWYAFDERGRWIYRRGTLRRMKGWGKDPVAAVLCANEALGPCRIFQEGRRFVVRPHPSPWVQIVAVSRDQARTTMRLFPGLFPDETRERFRIEVNKQVIYARNGRAMIESITSSPTSAEGPRATFVLRNEVQNWLSSNEGHEMAEVLDGNLAKSNDGSARALSLCNAHVPGTDSVAEREWEAYQEVLQQRTKATDILYDSLEAPPDTRLADEASLRRGLELARGNATWLDIDRLVAEIYDPRTSPSEARRKYLNQLVAAEDALVAPHEWDQLGNPPAPALEDDDQIALGFDGSKSDDHTGLQATRISDGAWFDLGIWDPAQHGGEAPRDLINDAVETAFGKYDVVAFFGDVEGWESYLDRWADRYGEQLCVKASPRHAIAWDMRGRQKEFTLEGVERLINEVAEQAFRHDASPRLRQHVHNARRRPNAWGTSFGKEHRESKRKVDGLAAGVLSRMARRAYLALPPNRQRRKRSGRAAFF